MQIVSTQTSLVFYVSGVFASMFVVLSLLYLFKREKALSKSRIHVLPLEDYKIVRDKTTTVCGTELREYFDKNYFGVIFSGVYSDGPTTQRVFSELVKSVNFLKIFDATETFKVSWALQQITRVFLIVLFVLLG